MASLVLGALFMLLIHNSSALYEDQINKYDWKREYIGKIEHVSYDSTLSLSKNLYVTTNRNAIASLSSKNGQINWRQVSDEKIMKMLHFSDGIITVSSSGIVRVWDPANGLLKWDVNLISEVSDDSKSFDFVDIAIMEMTYTEGKVITVLTTTGLFSIRAGVQSSAKSKSRVKYATLSNTQGSESKLFVDSESKQIMVLNIHEGLSVSALFYDPKTLEVEDLHMVQAAWLDNTKNIVVLENKRLLYASKEMDALYILDLQKGVEISNEPLSALEITSGVLSMHASKDKDMTYKGEDFHIVTENSEVVHLRIGEKDSISVIGRIQGSKETKVLGVNVMKLGSERYFFVVKSQGRNLKVNAFDETSGKEDTSLALDYNLPEDVGNVDKVFINMHLKRTSPVGYRALVTTSDDCVMMVTLPTRLAWRREEALASVVAAEMLDLPLSDIEARIEVEFEQAEKMNVVEMFVNRVQAQLGQVQSFAKHLTKGIKDGTLFEKKTKDPLIQDESLTRDPFSLHKMLVLVTNCGKIFGIDSLSGEIIWRLYAPEMADKKLKLFVRRTTAHFPHPPSALLMGNEDPEISSVTSIMTFNPITGERVKDQNPKEFSDIIQVMLLPFVDSVYLRPLLLLDKDANVRLLPNTPDVKEQLEAVRNSIYLFNVDKKTGKISGYWLQKNLKMLETFAIKIPDDQKVVLVKGKDPFEKIDALGRPLADRSVIYKYLNPNLVLVVTASKDVSDASSITMYLIDGVSGHIVHYATHKKSSGPIHAVHSENWIIYSYWNTKGRRTEIATYELYEGKQLRNGTSFSSFHNVPGVPVVFSQAYILGGTVSAMGVSKTERGLTQRQILLGLGRGAVFGMPRRFFDPRRPLNPEQSDREEGLIPYAPEIMVHPSLLINYNKTIQGITNIYSCPSALESTSIVLVTGLDIFFTRTQPSKMFDVLKEDFEYLLIAAVLSTMFIAAVVTRKLAQNKKLKKAWK